MLKERDNAMKRMGFLVVSGMLLVLAGCTFGFRPPNSKNTTGTTGRGLEIIVDIPGQVAARGAGRGVNQDEEVKRVFVKVISISPRQVLAPSNPSSNESLATELTKVDGVWRGRIGLATPMPGSIILLAYAVNEHGSHLYAGTSQPLSSDTGTVYIAMASQYAMGSTVADNWGPGGGFLVHRDDVDHWYYEFVPENSGPASWTAAVNGSESLVQGGYEDWFLASQDLTTTLFNSLAAMGSAATNFGFSSSPYWSSTESGTQAFAGTTANAWSSYAKDSPLLYRPVRRFSYGPTVKAVAAGSEHTMILKTDGSLWATGNNADGQLGLGISDESVTVPALAATEVLSVAAGASFTMIVKKDGTLWATGDNSFGQHGDGTTNGKLAFVQITSMGNDNKAVAAGLSHTLILKNDGRVFATGGNDDGRLGDGTTDDRLTPVQVMTEVAAVAAGDWHSLFLKTDGSLWAAGWNLFGQLGDGTDEERHTPVMILPSGVKAISAGALHSVFLQTDGRVYGMGLNDDGQLGDGSILTRYTPVQMLNINSSGAAIAAGSFHTMVLKSDGSVWNTGYNEDGELGDGTQTGKTVPVLISSMGYDNLAVSAGGSHSAFIKTNGRLWTTGLNNMGQLGDGTSDDKLTPVHVPGF